MRILECSTDQSVKNIILYLNKEEAKELYDSIEILIQGNDDASHAHINDSTFEHEVTLLIYDENKLESLDERSKNIILYDI